MSHTDLLVIILIKLEHLLVKDFLLLAQGLEQGCYKINRSDHIGFISVMATENKQLLILNYQEVFKQLKERAIILLH